MSSLVRLRATARAVRRAPGELQFGLSPGHGIVLSGLSEPETQLLLSLVNTGGTSQELALAESFGVPTQRVRDLVAALHGHHLLDDPAAIRVGHEDHTVCVPGHGSVVEQIRAHLVDAGVGEVLAEATHERDHQSADLVLICAVDAVAPDVARRWQESGTPHLPVILRDGTVIVGPLVLPGRSPCLRCLDLTRRDRDQAWPRILTQIASPTMDLGRQIDAPSTHAATIAALVTMIGLECLTDDRVTGVSWQLTLPWPELCTRAWSVHPECGCAQP